MESNFFFAMMSERYIFFILSGYWKKTLFFLALFKYVLWKEARRIDRESIHMYPTLGKENLVMSKPVTHVFFTMSNFIVQC